MTFEQAMQAMRDGKRVKIPKWPDTLAMAIDEHGEMYNPESIIAVNSVSYNVIMSEDWEIVEAGE